MTAGVGRVIECTGRSCPANPPETGPACWWYSYEATAAGSVGRLACLSPGNHYLDGLQGLKLTIAAGAEPPELIEPSPQPDPEAARLPPAPAVPNYRWIRVVLGLAGLSALCVLGSRPRWPAWRLRRAAANYARAPSPETLDILSVCVRKMHPQAPSEIPALLAEHLQQLDAARFGGFPLPEKTRIYFAGEAGSRLAARV